MSKCPWCDTRTERPCDYVGRTRECYRALISALRHRAERCGYAVTVHGSLKTDIDLVAVPWREAAVSQHHLAAELKKVIEVVIGCAREREVDANPAKKPNGRLAWSFYLTPHEQIVGPYVDLSVFPPCTEKPDSVKMQP